MFGKNVAAAWSCMVSWSLKASGVFAAALASAAAMSARVDDARTAPPVSLEQLVEMRDITSLTPSPDGRWLAFRVDHADLRSNRTVLEWFVMPTSGRGGARALGSAGDPDFDWSGVLKTAEPSWSADGTWLYFREIEQARAQISRIRVRDGRKERVTDDAADVIDFTYDQASGILTYAVGAPRQAILDAEKAEYDDGVLIDHRILGESPLFGTFPVNGRLASGRLAPGKWVAWQTLLGDSRPILKSLTVGAAARIATDAEVARYRAGQGADAHRFGRLPTTASGLPSPDGRWVAYTRPGEDGGSGPRLAVRSLATGNVVDCAARACREGKLAGLRWDDRSGGVVFASLDGIERPTLYRWDLRARTVRTLIRLDGFFSGERIYAQMPPLADCPQVGSVFFCITAAAARPPRIEQISNGGKTRVIRFDPNPALSRAAYPKVEPVAWSGPSNFPYQGVLVFPSDYRAGKRYPLVMVGTRCVGYLKGGPGDEFPIFGFASAGLFTLCLKEHLHGDAKDIESAYRDGVAEYRLAVDYLDARGLIDRTKVAAAGQSHAGELVGHIMGSTALLAAGSISDSPAPERSRYLLNGTSHSNIAAGYADFWGLPSPFRDSEGRWSKASLAERAPAWSGALLIQTPEASFRDSMPLVSALTDAGKAVEIVAFPDELHNFWQPVHRLSVYSRNIAWLSFWLSGSEKAAANEDQAARWRALKAKSMVQ